jgi:DNA (cytosine-5)-methyltransferase 1
VAWEPLGWTPQWFAEISPFPSAVLAHRWPEVKNFGDFKRIGADATPVDVLVGGTPCQSFSVAGLRGGLADERGNLALEYLRLATLVRPRWIVWENVPGVLSSGGGRDLGAFLGALAELGYGWAYRVLDAQNWGVPQRRRRVFVVAGPRTLLGDFAASGAAREKAPADVAGGLGTRCRGDLDGHGADISAAVTAKWAKGSGGPAGDECQNLVACATGNVTHCLTTTLQKGATEDGTGRGSPIVNVPDAHALAKVGVLVPAQSAVDIIFNDANGTRKDRPNGGMYVRFVDIAGALTQAESDTKVLVHQTAPSPMSVRRLTPRECERLQGFPDDHTLIPYRGKPASDGPRYHAIGNSMAVPVVRWIGERIAKIEAAE